MEIFIIWVGLSIAAGILASNRGRGGIAWFFCAIFFTPLLAFVLLLVMKNKSAITSDATPTPNTHVKCPDCRELVLRDANVCKHCGCKLIPQ